MAEPIQTPLLQLINLSVTFPNGKEGLDALDEVSFNLYPQEFVCVLGPSGGGKSTLLRVIAGLLPPTSGEIIFNPQGQAKKNPQIGLVFQQANLMPWRTVLENILLPLELRNQGGEDAGRQAEELIELVGLKGFESSWPRDLSGGMAQRVAIARSLIQDPDLLLLDEPFGSLDAITRERMEIELLRIWQARQKTVLMVTHSISEALLLSDRVLVFTSRPGKIILNMPIDLPRPRQDETRYSPHFVELSKILRQAIA